MSITVITPQIMIDRLNQTAPSFQFFAYELHDAMHTLRTDAWHVVRLQNEPQMAAATLEPADTARWTIDILSTL